MNRIGLAGFLILVPLLTAQPFTRGVGVYPGEPSAYTGPLLRPDTDTYRNLALHRPAYHSSSYDYNLTAQLVTDGIKATRLPRWIAVATSQEGLLPKNEREHLFDDNWVTSVDLDGGHAWIQVELAGGDSPLEIDRFGLDARIRAASEQPEEWTCAVLASTDGQNWKAVGSASGQTHAGGDVNASIVLREPLRQRHVRLVLDAPTAMRWTVNEVKLFRGNRRVRVAGPYQFTSAWKSAAGDEQWVYVDLGAICTFDRLTLYWLRRASEGLIQISDDAHTWSALVGLPKPSQPVDDLRLSAPAHARFVRVLMTKPASPDGYILSEFEVYGRGGPVAEPQPPKEAPAGGRLDLDGGSWHIERDSQVMADGPTLSRPGFRDQDWVPATVPATTLVSYLNAGAIPDPAYGDNLLMISDSFFYADFWCRREFMAPANYTGKQIWLNFDGINWKADVFLNGEKLGRIEGAFTRARFDVTHRLRPGQTNALAVRIEKNASPGSIKEKTAESPDKNGGALGADDPTFHAAVGWDWIPTVPGRDTGIWNSVWLSATGPVTLENPLVTTSLPLPDTSRADVAIEVSINNHDVRSVTGILRGRFGDAAFETPITVDAGASRVVHLDPSTQPVLRVRNPRLWWPAGYGEPNLYPVELRFEIAGQGTSDAISFSAGVRQFTYNEDGGALRIWINGRRLIPRGGNWGFSEFLLRYRAREYEAAVRYHREMGFNMIRDWVGQIGDDAFYEACDRNGIVVWQDFWLANPWDGPDPDDDAMFLRNAQDYLLRIRTHPSLGLYVGRNEGYPPKPIDDALRQMVASLTPGMHYISSSADDVVSGHGPYRAMPVKYYFESRATPKLHSEMGMPNIPPFDSVRRMMPDTSLWPQGAVWGFHDFTNSGAQNGASFRSQLEESYGPAATAAEWVSLAQFLNYDGYRAMFEAQSRNRMGLLIWMSHPAWPSFVWQTYDYYLEPTAAYFGAKKANEPLHIQWNPVTDQVEVMNYSAGNVRGLSVEAQILNLDGAVKWKKTAPLDSSEDSVTSLFHLEYPAGLTPVYFVRLRLSRGATLISENFYWRGLEENNYRALRDLPKVTVTASTTALQSDGRWRLTTELRNASPAPAIFVRLKVVREKSRDRILPAIYSDNYVSLMPGERRTLTTELANADTRGEAPRIVVEGFNIQNSAIDARVP